MPQFVCSALPPRNTDDLCLCLSVCCVWVCVCVLRGEWLDPLDRALVQNIRGNQCSVKRWNLHWKSKGWEIKSKLLNKNRIRAARQWEVVCLFYVTEKEGIASAQISNAALDNFTMGYCWKIILRICQYNISSVYCEGPGRFTTVSRAD